MINYPLSEIQLTNDALGHTIHHTQVFSPDDQWIVFDTRNYDDQIASTGKIRMVNVSTKEIKELYHVVNQTAAGPGVGAATFSPKQNRVLFIHGIRNSAPQKPYAMHRRTGVAVDIDQPGIPIFMDARNIDEPYTKGALRGGTHAHSWSGDGKWICFTYNDAVMAELNKSYHQFSDLRTVGVMAPLGEVKVNETASLENNSGLLFTAVVAQVVDHPAAGTDEIDKAFDECWIGKNGYLKPDGSHQHRAIAFQGNVKDINGKTKTEVFVVDIPEDISRENKGKPLCGTALSRPEVPMGVIQKRITYTEKGIEGLRFWLRSNPDGSLIAFLARDADDNIQIFALSPNGGEIQQITNNRFSVQGQFNFSPDGNKLAYIADNSIFLTDLQSRQTQRLSNRFADDEKPVNAVVWSNKGDMLAYNRYLGKGSDRYLQIFMLLYS
jgi:Tol biopolymer transport system component